VTLVQAILNDIFGQSPKLSIDGNFGPLTGARYRPSRGCSSMGCPRPPDTERMEERGSQSHQLLV
jgi:hypothetical protein